MRHAFLRTSTAAPNYFILFSFFFFSSFCHYRSFFCLREIHSVLYLQIVEKKDIHVRAREAGAKKKKRGVLISLYCVNSPPNRKRKSTYQKKQIAMVPSMTAEKKSKELLEKKRPKKKQIRVTDSIHATQKLYISNCMSYVLTPRKKKARERKRASDLEKKIKEKPTGKRKKFDAAELPRSFSSCCLHGAVPVLEVVLVHRVGVELV